MLSLISSRRLPLSRTYAKLRTLKPAPYGQPHPASHPHLLKPGEMTSGIQQTEYQARRARLMHSLPEEAIVLSVAAPIQYMSGKIFYKYRQNSDFWYLTGWQEPQAAILMQKEPSSRKGFHLTAFVAPKDEHAEMWDGTRTGVDAAAELLQADEVQPYDAFLPHIHHILRSLPSPTSRRSSNYTMDPTGPVIYADADARTHWFPIGGLMPEIAQFFDGRHSRRRSLRRELAPFRAVKSPAEQKIMHKAARITAEAHRKTMTFAKAGKQESDLAAHFAYLSTLEGSQRLAYEPVVASGPNGLAIHYTTNTAVLEDQEMVLIDAGCELDGYASDLTRTFPVSGKFTNAQQDLYCAVLRVQKTCIEHVSENAAVSMHNLYFEASRLLAAELERIGFPKLMDREVHDVLFPHSLGHSVGVDLHEPHFDSSAKLRTGMVVTIEPGVYVPPDTRYPTHFHNLAIRIEDQILVQKDHAVVLTSSAPKEVVDVEGACQDILALGYF